MRLTRILAIVPLLLFAITGLASCRGGTSSTGTGLYGEYCLACHGEAGRGDGRLSYLVHPKPRDFTSGKFKIRSTPSGSPPTDDDIIRTIRSGLPGTAMPSFAFLKDEDIRKLAVHVKTLAGLEGKPAPVPLAVPPVPQNFAGLKDEGKRIFTEAGCNVCHGDSGRGDGEGASVLRDEWNDPITPRDFTQGVFLGGGKPEDLYLRILTGLDGTPMIPQKETLLELAGSEAKAAEYAWSLAAFVKGLEDPELAQARSAEPPREGTIVAAVAQPGATKEQLTDFARPEWAKAQPLTVPLSRLWKKDRDNHEHALVKAIANSAYVAVMLSWRDDSENKTTDRVQDFQDAAAVQFSLTPDPGFHGMGSRDHPADIWQWKAEWQARMERGAETDITGTYANRASDGHVSDYPAPIAETARLPGTDAGNPLSARKIATPVEDANAAGPQTLATQPAASQQVAGLGRWDGKSWSVIFVRERKASGPEDVSFEAGENYPVAFAVWDGELADRDGQKLVSSWNTIKF